MPEDKKKAVEEAADGGMKPGVGGTTYMPFPVLGLASDNFDTVLVGGGGGAMSAKEVPNVVLALRYDEEQKQLHYLAKLSTDKSVVEKLTFWKPWKLYLASVKGTSRILELDKDDNTDKYSLKEHCEWPTETEGKEPTQNIAIGSPDGKLIATGGTDGALRLWEVSDSEQVPKKSLEFKAEPLPPGNQKEINDVAWSPDSKLLGFCDGSGALRIFSVATGNQANSISFKTTVAIKGPPPAIKSACFITPAEGQETPRIVAAATAIRGPSWLVVYDVGGAKLREVKLSSAPVRSMTVSANEKFAAVCLCDGTTMVYRVPSLAFVMKKAEDHDLPATGVGFLGKETVVSGSGSYSVSCLSYARNPMWDILKFVIFAILILIYMYSKGLFDDYVR